MIRFVLRGADRVVAISDQTLRLAESIGLDRDRMSIVPPGVDLNKFDSSERADPSAESSGSLADVPLPVSTGLSPSERKMRTAVSSPSLIKGIIFSRRSGISKAAVLALAMSTKLGNR